jgi:hypothetical protein
MRPLVIVTIGLLGCSNAPSQNPMSSPPDASPPDSGSDAPPAGPAQQIVTSGLLQAVSPDQSSVAYVTSPSSVDGVLAGTLTVSLVAAAGNTSVASDAFSATFAGNANVLMYLTGPTASIDAGQSTVYGGANLWQPGMTAGVRLSKGLAPIRVTALDNSWTLFWDTPTASNQGVGDVELVRAADCGTSTCTLLRLATGVTVASMVLSPDGTYAAYSVKNAPGSFGVFLVTIASGTVTTIASAASTGSIGFSPDGALLASVGPASALQVTTTATGATAPWSALPSGTKSLTVGFADPTTLLVRGQVSGGATVTVYKTTAAAASPIASGPSTLTMLIVRNTAATTGTAHHLFTSMTPANGIGDVEAYDLAVAAPTAIPVASAAALNSIAVSSDQTYARVLDAYDPNARTGTLTLVSLSNGSPSTLPSGVTLAASSFTNVHSLMYIDPANHNALTELTDAATTTFATGVTAYRLRSGTLYFSLDTPDDLYGYPPGIYSTAFP